MSDDTRMYIVQRLDDQVWKREGVYVHLDDAKHLAEARAISTPGVFYRVIDDDGLEDAEPAVYKLVQF